MSKFPCGISLLGQWYWPLSLAVVVLAQPMFADSVLLDRAGDGAASAGSETPPVAAPSETSGEPPLPVTVDYLRESFAEGYNRQAHAYESAWLEGALFDPPGRPVMASFCGYGKITVRQVPLDDLGDCEDLDLFAAPGGVAFVRWRLIDPARSILDNNVVAEQVYDLKPFRPAPGATCTADPSAGPLPWVVQPEACQFIANAPVKSLSEVAEDAHTYVAQLDWVDADGKVVRSGSQDISIPSYAPLVVSLGDSYASGEGNPDRPGKSEATFIDEDNCFRETTAMIKFHLVPDMVDQPYWLDSMHHRSLRSAPALAARELQKDWPYLVFLSLARSGAEIQDDEPDAGDQLDVIEQLGILRRLMAGHPDRQIDVLLISVGGNDIGFGDLLLKLTTGDLSGTEAEEEFEQNLLALQGVDPAGGGYPLLKWQIGEMGLNVRNIVLTEYPVALFNRENNEPREGCEIFAAEALNGDAFSVTKGEARRIYEVGTKLNEEIHATATRFDWGVVSGIAKRFESHGYCSGAANRFYVRAEESCDQQGDFKGVMHPNDRGTAAMAEEIAATVRPLLPHSNQVGGSVAPVAP